MNAETAATLQLPRSELFDYTRRAFAASEQAMDDLERSHDLSRAVEFFEFALNIRGLIIHQFQHTSRHVGMIEALCSIIEQQGIAIKQ
jgi:uncharacterized damage-inducible protein DinB